MPCCLQLTRRSPSLDGFELTYPVAGVAVREAVPGLGRNEKLGADLCDYEIELFTAEIVSMDATSGIARDWAAACRATL